MKFLFELLLLLAALIAGIYAATPLWLPAVVGSQLPPGWQLQELQAGYPDTTGVSIKTVRVSGALQSAKLALRLNDMRFTYRGQKSDIGSLTLDVFMQSDQGREADTLTLDDLSFPSTNLNGQLPEISIGQLQLTIHTDANQPASVPLVINFKSFKLRPGTDNNFQLDTQASIADHPDFQGQFDIKASESALQLDGQMRAVLDAGIVTLEMQLLAKREGENIRVSLPGKSKIEFQDTTAKFTGLIAGEFPELQRTPQPDALLVLKIAAQSGFVIRPGRNPSILFDGGLKLDMESAHSIASLQARELEVEITDFSNPENAKINGDLLLNWSENAPFTYSVDADSSPAMTIAVDKMLIQTQITLADGNFLANGHGSFIGGQIPSLAVSATKVEVDWQQLDLLNLAGKLSTTTQGFSAELDAETFTGFDFDVAYTLFSDSGVDGSGTMNFDSGVAWPFRFKGHTQAEEWSITLPPTSIKLVQLESLLAVANLELPAVVNLMDGYISIQGNIEVNEDLNAQVTVKGAEMVASMMESTASGGSFTFAVSYGETISVKGPMSIETVALAGGIDLTNIRAELKFEDPGAVSLKNLHADVFDGHIIQSDLQYSENRIEGGVIELTEIDFGDLLEFADIDGLEGTGKLDISLPAGSDEKGVYIKDGTFKSSRPGRLAYRQVGVAPGNIGLQALENFEYQDISGTINYQSDGAYRIGVRLEGRNPDLYAGQQIVFNLNINGSLPALFESMFITGNFDESILKQIRSNRLQ